MADNFEAHGRRALGMRRPEPLSAQLDKLRQEDGNPSHAKWFAVYVEEPKMAMLPEAERSRAADNLRLAGELGGRLLPWPAAT